MKFTFYKNNGTIGTTNTKIEDILAEVQPDDIIDGLDCIGITINRYFADILVEGVKYILWIDSKDTASVSLKKYAQSITDNDTVEEDAEDFQISNHERAALIAFAFGKY